ncbi:FAD-dependent oxidoreductase [bacterium]|nr:FAD-dependent oxidoreductase [bacterium]
MKDFLFEPIIINQLEIKNRIYLPAMHLGMANNFAVTDQILDFYSQRAVGGAGMICVGFATVDELSGSPLNIGAHKDSFIPGLTRLAETIKNNGSRSAVQLNHAGRYNPSFFLQGKKPVAPSAIASRLTHETPHEMTIDEIKQTIGAFANAARRVKTAGYDAVEVLSGTGYLISEFLSPLTNQRTDAYGGSFNNRMCFGLEVMAAIRDAVGADYPLIVRMNGNDFMPGGNSHQELIEYAQALAQGPADALCINVGWHEARVPQIVTCVPHGAFSYLSRSIKENVDIPVIASHRINDPATARELLANGMCDMVAMGRSLITDPQLPKKAQQGQENQILHCIGCAQGCFDHLFKMKHVECLCNPEAGHEGQRSLKKTTSPKKVMVVGGGPGGMSAALTASLQGHEVTLYEQSDRLGGQLHLAAAPPGRDDFAQLAKDLETQLRVNNIPVIFKQIIDSKAIASKKPDVVIVATGAIAVTPPIPGIELPHVVQAWDVLEDKVSTGTKVAIIGGGAVGVETALFLAEKGTLSAEAVKFLLVNKAEDPEVLYEMATKGSKKVVLVEMLNKVGKDIGKSTRWGMMQELSRAGIKSVTEHQVTEITPTGLTMKKGEDIVKIEAETIVIAAGSVSVNTLETTLQEMQVPFKVVGDAKQVALAFDAIHQGYEAALSL